MVKISMYKKDNGEMLVIYKTIKGNLIGELYASGEVKRGQWDSRCTFTEGCAVEYRVKEYFGFTNGNSVAYWKRWA